MAYAVEAVHWTNDERVDSVRWHPFEYVEGELEKGDSTVVGIASVAVAAARGHDLYLCYNGAVGRRIGVVHLPDGHKTLVDLPVGDQAQALSQLPRF